MGRFSYLLGFLSLFYTSIATGQAASHQALHDIAANVSARRIQQDVVQLVSFGTRHTLSMTDSQVRGIGAARRWIKAEFDQISAD